MGFIRNIINFLERFDRSAEIELKPIIQASKAKPIAKNVKTKPTTPKRNRVSQKAETEIIEAINVLFPGSWFKAADITNSVDYGGSTVLLVINKLIQNGAIESKGDKNNSARAYRFTNIPAKQETPAKKCNKCGKTKHLMEFSKRTKAMDGLQDWCKACVSASGRAAWARRKQEKTQRPALQYKMNTKTGEILEISKAN